MREKSGGPTYETHLYERWQESKKLREELQDLVSGFDAAGVRISHGTGMRFARLLQDAKHIESEAKAEYDAW